MAIDLSPIVEKHIDDFNMKRLEKIQALSVRALLQRKNPYLFVARNVQDAEELATLLISATLSSSEETQFGQTLENIAIDVCSEAFGGVKSAATGIDLEFVRDERRHIVSIKSGPAWGNSSQISKMRTDFRTAKATIRQGNPSAIVEAVNGCCYGRTDRDYGDYRKVCGIAFWELVSGEPDMSYRLMESLSNEAANGWSTDVDDATERIVEELETDWTNSQQELDWRFILNHNSK